MPFTPKIASMQPKRTGMHSKIDARLPWNTGSKPPPATMLGCADRERPNSGRRASFWASQGRRFE